MQLFTEHSLIGRIQVSTVDSSSRQLVAAQEEGDLVGASSYVREGGRNLLSDNLAHLSFVIGLTFVIVNVDELGRLSEIGRERVGRMEFVVLGDALEGLSQSRKEELACETRHSKVEKVRGLTTILLFLVFELCSGGNDVSKGKKESREEDNLLGLIEPVFPEQRNSQDFDS